MGSFGVAKCCVCANGGAVCRHTVCITVAPRFEKFRVRAALNYVGLPDWWVQGIDTNKWVGSKCWLPKTRNLFQGVVQEREEQRNARKGDIEAVFGVCMYATLRTLPTRRNQIAYSLGYGRIEYGHR